MIQGCCVSHPLWCDFKDTSEYLFTLFVGVDGLANWASVISVCVLMLAMESITNCCWARPYHVVLGAISKVSLAKLLAKHVAR